MTRTSHVAFTALLTFALGAFVFVSLRNANAPASAPSEASGAPAAGGTLRALLRDEIPTFNRYVLDDNALELLSHLVHARLVRVNRATDAIEPWLAERWNAEPDGRTYTLALRPGVTYSDGTPFTAADVLFAFEAVYSKQSASPIGDSLKPGGQPLEVSALDPQTLRIRFPAPFGPGLSILNNLPILARHKLEPALRAGKFKEAWNLTTPPSEMPGLGPFVIERYESGRRLSLVRNPRYWRRDAGGRQLPYLDGITFEIVGDMNAEILRLESGAADLMFNEVRPEDYASLRRLQDQGRLRLSEAGVSLDPPMFWFNLDPSAKASDPRREWLQATDFRRAISHAIDRDAIVNAVYLGLAVPLFGPITPGNKTWHVDNLPRYAYDPARARSLLAGLGLTDKNADGLVEDRAGRPARFLLITNRGNTIRERAAPVLQAQLRRVGLTVDVSALDNLEVVKRIISKNYDSALFGLEASSTDPAHNLDFWVSSGGFHLWHMNQAAPATDWERQIDDLMRHQIATTDLAERRRLFADVQRIFAENIPIIYLAAPRVIVATSPRVLNAQPVLLRPFILWNADTLAVRSGGTS